MHYSGTFEIIWFRGALPCAASLGFGREESISRRSAKLWFMHAGFHLGPGAAPECDKAPFGPLAALIPAGQSRTADHTLRLCYQAFVLSRAPSLANFSGAAFRGCENYTV
jgi:hypothetical protein